MNLMLSNPTGGAVIDAERGAAVLTIMDTGGVPPGGGDNRPGHLQVRRGELPGDRRSGLRPDHGRALAGRVAARFRSTTRPPPAAPPPGTTSQATSGTLSWANDDGSTKTFQVPMFDDNLAEDTETILLALSDATNGAGIDPSAARRC